MCSERMREWGILGYLKMWSEQRLYGMQKENEGTIRTKWKAYKTIQTSQSLIEDTSDFSALLTSQPFFGEGPLLRKQYLLGTFDC